MVKKMTPMPPPVMETSHGRAWLCDTAVGMKKMGFTSEYDATLAHWVVEAPWAHPHWHSYSIILVHLRPMLMPDGKPASTKFYLDGATHEIWVYALDPDGDRATLVKTGILDETCKWLTPKNFAAQFIEVTDDLARERVKSAVRQIVDGKLSPDTDYIRTWMHLFGDNMIKDKEHAGETKIIVGGGEPDPNNDNPRRGMTIVIPPKLGPQDKH